VVQLVIQYHQLLIQQILVNVILVLTRLDWTEPLSIVKKLVNQRPQLTLPQAILVPVIQAMLFYHLLVQLINVLQFVMQHHQLTKLQAILVIV
jgi:hypothetical protein